ncbi:MAG: 2-succinyl-5-enolpyruvyl-6-hydroxy-3-cyclohexene-1-carboxylic-acid synthase [Flavobacteriales bacterium]|nr:2-succinyl-5-enolpyruvyl-6-hydroxy-3-cyclohexene-1-carboxylate synthase [Flavobacteriales bacterium]MCC6576318.1 2-succinyl-5-enolpyruvyl-6-hydroxy-3-cyclohexene-1-carboxylic-acid synthase [Flavobacteriales bacterium]NUQ15247.1 2-succinyl-5-enolpyruvyl-6-hydroxy-3-cyclohexene-1-carboxylic-acid synthase [Flavobacteriales bacterium]
MTSDHFVAAELARLCAAKGVRHAVISPGSRSAPLVFAFHHHPDITCLQVVDERSAAFFALGMALQLHAPVALICTSGSAVLNYGPAIAEAFYQRVPLLVISADRPEEWADQGEGQAIRQRDVLAPHMKHSVQLPRDPADELARWHCGRSINEAIDHTLLPVPGPVHVNVPFAEPLYGRREHPPEDHRRLIAPVMTGPFILPGHARWLIGQVSSCRKVMVLAGQGLWSPGLKAQLQRLATLPQVAVLTEATANLDDPAFITCIDRALEGVNDANENDLRPDLLITFGGAVVSKRIKALLRKWRPAQHWHVDEGQRHHDTYQSLTHDIAVSAGTFFAQIMNGAQGGESFYGEAWRMVDQRMRGAQARLLREAPFCDLTVFATLNDRIPGGSDVHLANSTPARYAQLFDRVRDIRWYGNRGTSGIDGCTSTAAGAAHASGRLTTLVTGDIAFCYDSNALWNDHLSPLLKIIVIDNGGGNIFRYIEGPDTDPALLPWFEAPHERSIAKLVRSFDLPYFHATDQPSLEQGLDLLYGAHDRPAVLHITTDAQIAPKVLREHFKQLREAGAPPA